MESLIEIAERRGDVPALVDYVSGFAWVVPMDARGRDIGGAEFAGILRRHYGVARGSACRMGVLADIAERYIYSLYVRFDSSCTMFLNRDVARAVHDWRAGK